MSVCGSMGTLCQENLKLYMLWDCLWYYSDIQKLYNSKNTMIVQAKFVFMEGHTHNLWSYTASAPWSLPWSKNHPLNLTWIVSKCLWLGVHLAPGTVKAWKLVFLVARESWAACMLQFWLGLTSSSDEELELLDIEINSLGVFESTLSHVPVYCEDSVDLLK